MKGYRHARRLAAAALALSLLASSPAYAADSGGSSSVTAGSALTVSFSDVSASHWAIKHITKLASMGVIQGFEKAEFRPENSVTQQDAIIMAVRLMGLESEALKNKADTVLPFSVDNYAKPYVAYAIDRALIDIQEETEGQTAKTAWGSREATREWVARLVIRAIGKQSVANEQAQLPVSFTDSSDFSSWAGGYVNAASSLGIVQGFENNSFQPKGKVTRAQMATFFSRSDKYLATRIDRVVTGYVMGLTDNSISIMNAQGETKMYTISSATSLYSGKDDTRIPASKIKLTNEVYLIQNQGNALYIELTNEEQKMETVEGTLNKVLVNQMMVLLQQNGTENVYYLDPSVVVTDKDGRGLSLSMIAQGSVIQLQRNTLLKEQKYSQLIVKQIPVSKQAEGTVLSISKEQNQIVFLESSTGQNETYPIAARAFVTLADGTTTDLTRLHVGDTVVYNVQTNELVSVTIKKAADVGLTVQGTLTSLSDDKKILTIARTGGATGLGAYYLADNALVTIEGLANASLYDLEIGDALTLQLVNDRIVEAKVTSRSISQMVFATILSYDPNSKVLTVTSDSGEPNAYTMADNTSIVYGDATLPLSNFQSMFIDAARPKKVDLKVSKKKVVQIQLTQKIEGTVAQVNTLTNQLTIRTPGGQNLTFNTVGGLAVEMLNQSAGTLASLKVGDAVTATLNYTQDYISALTMKRVGVYKTLVVNASTRQVTLKDENGTLFTFTVENDDKISNPGKTTHLFSDIVVDEYVKASFDGSKLGVLQLLNTVRGKVSAVDATAGTITVQDFQSGIQVVPVGQQFIIKENGTTSAALTALQIGDRVEIIKDANEKYIIQVALPTKRVVSSYDVVLNQLLLKPTVNGDKTTYNFFSKAYLHKGTQVVAANAFMENEEVTIYLLDDKIFEIEKP